jgi:hypothetical protein
VTVHEVLTGRVEARNAKGILVAGDWRNVSKFAPMDLPPIGAMVRAAVDSKGFLLSLEVLDQEPPPPDRRASAELGRHEDLRRLEVLKAAAAFGTSRPDLKSGDVLRIADSWLLWVLGLDDA